MQYSLARLCPNRSEVVQYNRQNFNFLDIRLDCNGGFVSHCSRILQIEIYLQYTFQSTTRPSYMSGWWVHLSGSALSRPTCKIAEVSTPPPVEKGHNLSVASRSESLCTSLG